MSERDPRKDPRPGDLLSYKGRTRNVYYVGLDGTVFYDTKTTSKECTKSTWARWAKKDGVKVVHKASDDPHEVVGVKIKISRRLMSVVTGMANRIMDKSGSVHMKSDDPDRIGWTPSDEVLEALVDAMVCMPLLAERIAEKHVRTLRQRNIKKAP